MEQKYKQLLEAARALRKAEQAYNAYPPGGAGQRIKNRLYSTVLEKRKVVDILIA